MLRSVHTTREELENTELFEIVLQFKPEEFETAGFSF